MPPRELYANQIEIRPVNSDGTYGKPIELDSFGPFVLEDAPLVTPTSDTISFGLLRSTPITLTGELKLPHKKMSRKTFKKWLMHFPWINRNEAEAYCYLIGITKGRISYGTTYQDVSFLINFERPSIVLFNSFIRQLKETEE